MPEEDQIPPEAIVTEPFTVTCALFAQTVWVATAETVGAGVNRTARVFVTEVQPPLFVEVIVSVMEPPVISAALGR